jgi:hypothetical protein
MLALVVVFLILLFIILCKYEMNHHITSRQVVLRRHQTWVVESYGTFLCGLGGRLGVPTTD